MKHLEPTSRWRAMWMCHPKMQRTYRNWKHQIVLPPACHLGPWPRGCHPVALIQNIVWRYVWLWQKSWGQYPHPITLGQPPLLKICCAMLELDSQKQWWQVQGWQFFSVGDIQWGRAWPQARLEILHSFSQELVHGFGKLAYLAADPMTIQKGKRAIAWAMSDCWVKVKGPGCPCVNLPAQQPFWFNPPRSSPPKDASGDCSSDYPPSPHQPSRGWEHNRHQRDQRPQSPQFLSPSPDCGFESDRSSLSTTSLMLSRSD